MVRKVDCTPFKALSKPVVSPPISTVIPLILLATQIPPLLKMGIKNARKLPSIRKASIISNRCLKIIHLPKATTVTYHSRYHNLMS